MLKKLFNSKSKLLNLALALLLSASFLLNILLAVRLGQVSSDVQQTVGYFDEENSENNFDTHEFKVDLDESLLFSEQPTKLEFNKSENNIQKKDPTRLNWDSSSLLEKAYLAITNPENYYTHLEQLVYDNVQINNSQLSRDRDINIIEIDTDELTEGEIIQRSLIILASKIIEEDIREIIPDNDEYDDLAKKILEKTSIELGESADEFYNLIKNREDGSYTLGTTFDPDLEILIISISKILDDPDLETYLKKYARFNIFLATINEISHFLTNKVILEFPGMTRIADTVDVEVNTQEAWSYTSNTDGMRYYFTLSVGPNIITVSKEGNIKYLKGIGEAISSSLSELYKHEIETIGSIYGENTEGIEITTVYFTHENFRTALQYVFFIKSEPKNTDLIDILISEDKSSDLSYISDDYLNLNDREDLFTLIDDIRNIESQNDLFGIFSSDTDEMDRVSQYINNNNLLNYIYETNIDLEELFLSITFNYYDVTELMQAADDEQLEKFFEMYADFVDFSTKIDFEVGEGGAI